MKKKILFIVMLFMTLTGSYTNKTNAAGGAGETMPEFVSEPPITKTVLEGQTLMIEARAIGTPAPEFRWYKDKHRIYESDRCSISYDEEGRTTLTIKNMTLNDIGTYEVVAENSVGMVSETCLVFVSTIP
ncbi:immunoglobulin domain-containing protein [Sanguibacteroides justesenii]|uniref:Ig-like domain-containing protein n=1 Tax=Sanguibacteroides justesenii TaxID=1547597 RepID=A0AB34R620_9PORP|nr:immunoglobulin domain-containing protein [Sanguibacteroides justesenii]KIO47436.1 hypothetical protein IE90_00240 [Sanguibacteroides justesenii]